MPANEICGVVNIEVSYGPSGTYLFEAKKIIGGRVTNHLDGDRGQRLLSGLVARILATDSTGPGVKINTTGNTIDEDQGPGNAGPEASPTDGAVTFEASLESSTTDSEERDVDMAESSEAPLPMSATSRKPSKKPASKPRKKPALAKKKPAGPSRKKKPPKKSSGSR